MYKNMHLRFVTSITFSVIISFFLSVISGFGTEGNGGGRTPGEGPGTGTGGGN